jgi:hypothetical protein
MYEAKKSNMYSILFIRPFSNHQIFFPQFSPFISIHIAFPFRLICSDILHRYNRSLASICHIRWAYSFGVVAYIVVAVAACIVAAAGACIVVVAGACIVVAVGHNLAHSSFPVILIPHSNFFLILAASYTYLKTNQMM